MQCQAGVTAVASVFLLAAAYLISIGLVMIFSPGSVGMRTGDTPAHERRAFGILLLVPSVSSAVVDFRASTLAWGGFGVMIRVIIAWYLFQEPVRIAFQQG